MVGAAIVRRIPRPRTLGRQLGSASGVIGAMDIFERAKIRKNNFVPGVELRRFLYSPHNGSSALSLSGTLRIYFPRLLGPYFTPPH